MIKKQLENNVDKVKTFLNRFNINSEFFIAGGSVFSLLQGLTDNYNDIDVYFYSEEPLLALNSIKEINFYRTYFALTYPGYIGFEEEIFPEAENTPFQFIKIVYGEPLDVFKTFDLNCSMCCITSNKQIILDEKFSNIIDINWDVLSSGTLNRYNKYISQKNTKDENGVLEQIFEYLINNTDKKFDSSYKGGKFQSSIDILYSYLKFCEIENQYKLYDIIENKTPQEKIIIYEKIIKVLSIKPNDPSTEFLLMNVLFKHSYFKSPKDILKAKQLVMKDYPEYFI